MCGGAYEKKTTIFHERSRESKSAGSNLSSHYREYRGVRTSGHLGFNREGTGVWGSTYVWDREDTLGNHGARTGTDRIGQKGGEAVRLQSLWRPLPELSLAPGRLAPVSSQ